MCCDISCVNFEILFNLCDQEWKRFILLIYNRILVKLRYKVFFCNGEIVLVQFPLPIFTVTIFQQEMHNLSFCFWEAPALCIISKCRNEFAVLNPINPILVDKIIFLLYNKIKEKLIIKIHFEKEKIKWNLRVPKPNRTL